MSDKPNKASIREFVASIRSALDAGGHPGIAIERMWFDDIEGQPLLIQVPVGPEYRVPLSLRDGLHQTSGSGLSQRSADVAAALVNLAEAESTLEAFADGLRLAAREAVARARKAGFQVQLDGVGFSPVDVSLMGGTDWEDACEYALLDVRVSHTSSHLRPDVSTFSVGNREDLEEALDTLCLDQAEWQTRLAEREAEGADLEIDGIAIELLRAHNLTVEDVLRTVWKNQHAAVDVTFEGRDGQLSLVTSEGVVEVSLHIDGVASWNGANLWFSKDRQPEDVLDLAGATLDDRMNHPVFKSRRIAAVEKLVGSDTALVSFVPSEHMLFDGDTGRIWPKRGLAA